MYVILSNRRTGVGVLYTESNFNRRTNFMEKPQVIIPKKVKFHLKHMNLKFHKLQKFYKPRKLTPRTKSTFTLHCLIRRMLGNTNLLLVNFWYNILSKTSVLPIVSFLCCNNSQQIPAALHIEDSLFYQVRTYVKGYRYIMLCRW